jgi:hypothetical protein
VRCALECRTLVLGGRLLGSNGTRARGNSFRRALTSQIAVFTYQVFDLSVHVHYGRNCLFRALGPMPRYRQQRLFADRELTGSSSATAAAVAAERTSYLRVTSLLMQ